MQVGQHLVRINLSEATDMMDLLGADLPAEGGAPGQVWTQVWGGQEGDLWIEDAMRDAAGERNEGRSGSALWNIS